MSLETMAAADEGANRHAGGDARKDPVDAVFNDEALGRRRPEAIGGVKEEVGSRLSAGDGVAGIDVRQKVGKKAEARELVIEDLGAG
jgi:hypothetical protein